MSEEVTVYTTEDCSFCDRLLLLLDKFGVEYEEIDATGADLEFTRMPQIVFPDGSILTGFNPGKVRKKIIESRQVGLS